ncbi:hypothetical protein EYF80_026819 [Liparis tanakae]|uniref:Uncharacterized protein n=1 Tax=Liparis tanakae TaxID=230148 RepID=A0A4Z2HAU8_9TELE|nr:hypothetical protein EYF80_026819 [Liparis tanakae]
MSYHFCETENALQQEALSGSSQQDLNWAHRRGSRSPAEEEGGGRRGFSRWSDSAVRHSSVRSVTTGVRSAQCQRHMSSRTSCRTRVNLAPLQHFRTVKRSRTVILETSESGSVLMQDKAEDRTVSCSSADREGKRAATTSLATSTPSRPGPGASSSDSWSDGRTDRASRPGTASSHSGTQTLTSRQAAAVVSRHRVPWPASVDTLARRGRHWVQTTECI